MSKLRVADHKMETITEADYLRSVFPEEVWLLIEEKVKDADAGLGLCKSSSYFKNLFKGLPVRVLFPQVAKILYEQLKFNNRKEVQEVLNRCRLVCRNWKKSVDCVLQNVPHWFQLNEQHNGFIYYTPFQSCIPSLQTNQKIIEFQQDFRESHFPTNCNPLACRSVSICCGPPGDAEIATEQVLQFLKGCGHHIWHVKLRICLPEILHNILPSYQRLHEILKLLPNLKSLVMFQTPSVFFEESIQQLRLHVKANPFPNLKDLHSFKVKQLPTPISDGILQANPQITTCYFYNILHPVVEDCGYYPFNFKENLPNLQQLAILLKNEPQLRSLETLSFVWPLKKLWVSITQDVPYNDMIQLIGNKWAATLQELTLVFNYQSHPSDLVPLELPNLQKFSIKFAKFTPLDFLLQSRNSLRHLSVRPFIRRELETALQAEQTATVRFLEFRDNLFESNVWTLFPQLRCVEYFESYHGTIPTRTYRRFDWIQNQRKN